MFFDNFNTFYEQYKDIILKNNINKDDLESFWIRHCSKLKEQGCFDDNKISYKDKSTKITYNSYLDDDKIMINPYFEKDSFNNDKDKFFLSLGECLKSVEIYDGNIIIEKFNPKMKSIYIDIYDQEATNYFCSSSTLATFEKIDNIEKNIKTEGLLPDKTIKVYNSYNNILAMSIFKKGELVSSKQIDIKSINSLFLTRLDKDELLSDLNKHKIKKMV